MLQIDVKKFRKGIIMGNAIITKAVLVVGGFYGGYRLDAKFDTKPWLMFAGGVLGMALGLWYLLFLAKRTRD